jgi:uncharacterized protein (TIGR03083 family)
MATDAELVAALDEVWGSIEAFGAGLDEREWKAPTECPGWSVQDNVAHIVGIESVILGRPDPDHAAPGGDHVKNDFGAHNELWVDWYRDRSGAEVLEEFRAVTGERLAALRAPGSDFGADAWTPVGPGTVRDLLPFRIFDSWVHEQDARRAVGRPGDTDSAGGQFALDHIRSMMPRVVGKKVAPPDGTSVGFSLTGAGGRTFAIAMDGKRAALVDRPAADATACLTTDVDTFVRLTTGRGDAAEILASGAVAYSGDEALARAVARELRFLVF